MRISYLSVVLLAPLAVASPISTNAVKRWGGSQPNEGINERIGTVVKDLHSVEKTANSYTGGWYQSWEFLKETNALRKSLVAASNSVDASESLDEQESTDVVSAIKEFTPQMTMIMNALGERKEKISSSKYAPYVKTSIEWLRGETNKFFDNIKMKITGSDNSHTIQELQDDTDAQFVKAQQQLQGGFVSDTVFALGVPLGMPIPGFGGSDNVGDNPLESIPKIEPDSIPIPGFDGSANVGDSPLESIPKMEPDGIPYAQ